MKILVAFLLLCSASVVIASPIPDFPFIFVRGTASEEVQTKEVTIHFSVTKETKDSADGEAALVKASSAVRKLLHEAGIKDTDIQASDVSKSTESKDSANGEKEDIFFRLRQSFDVQIKDLTLYPKIAGALVSTDNVSDFDSSFLGGDKEAVTKRLRVAAIKDAKEKAAILAEAAGTQLGAVFSVSEFDHSEISSLIGESGGRDGEMYSPVVPSEAKNEVYKIQPTVHQFFGVRVLFRLKESNK